MKHVNVSAKIISAQKKYSCSRPLAFSKSSISVKPKIIASLSTFIKSAQFINSLKIQNFRSHELKGHSNF